MSLSLRAGLIHPLKPLSPNIKRNELVIRLGASGSTRGSPATEGRQVHRLVVVILRLKTTAAENIQAPEGHPNRLGKTIFLNYRRLLDR